jgi:hypothetical protein
MNNSTIRALSFFFATTFVIPASVFAVDCSQYNQQAHEAVQAVMQQNRENHQNTDSCLADCGSLDPMHLPACKRECISAMHENSTAAQSDFQGALNTIRADARANGCTPGDSNLSFIPAQ